jgi:hypothetical protein
MRIVKSINAACGACGSAMESTGQPEASLDHGPGNRRESRRALSAGEP